MNLILEFDDFNPKKEVNCLAEIEYLVDRYPDIKLTMFTPAMYENNTLRSDPKWCDRVRELIDSDNLRLAIHGCFHTSEEFKFKNKEEAISTIALAECMFRIAKLPFIRVFRGPHWGINQATYDALKWLEYTHVYTHPDYSTLADTNTDIKSIFYDWNLKDTYDPYKDPWNHYNKIIIGHGHTHNVCGNGIQEIMPRIIECIEEYKPTFSFADEI